MIQRTTPPGPPDLRVTLFDLISSLPVAAMASDPNSSAAVKQLSPVLRNRVEFLSSGSDEPWLRLLTYQPSQVEQLSRIARSEELQPHPVSGEIEIDWDSSSIRYKRVDADTFQAMVVLRSLNLFFCLSYFPGDSHDTEAGWRVSEVGVAAPTDSSGSINSVMEPYWGGRSTIADAEAAFGGSAVSNSSLNRAAVPLYDETSGADADDEDDSYWEQYNSTPSLDRGVSVPSPMPQQTDGSRMPADEDAYYNQYDEVQPALDNHDPDEAPAVHHDLIAPHRSLALTVETGASPDRHTAGNLGGLLENSRSSRGASILTPPDSNSSALAEAYLAHNDGRSRSSSQRSEKNEALLHPRPASRLSSTSNSVSRLEEQAERQDHVESSIKQHVSRNIRSLFELCRSNGIDRDEFERIVTTELDVFPLHDLEG